MLDYIHQMTLILLKILIFARKRQYFAIFTQRYNGRRDVTLLTYKPLVVYRFYCIALFHSQTRRHVISMYIKNW